MRKARAAAALRTGSMAGSVTATGMSPADGTRTAALPRAGAAGLTFAPPADLRRYAPIRAPISAPEAFP